MHKAKGSGSANFFYKGSTGEIDFSHARTITENRVIEINRESDLEPVKGIKSRPLVAVFDAYLLLDANESLRCILFFDARGLQQENERAGAAMDDYREAFEQARSRAAELLARLSSARPECAEEASALFEATQYRELERLARRELRRGRQATLAALTERIINGPGDEDLPPGPTSMEELLRRQEEEILLSFSADDDQEQRRRADEGAEAVAVHDRGDDVVRNGVVERLRGLCLVGSGRRSHAGAGWTGINLRFSDTPNAFFC